MIYMLHLINKFVKSAKLYIECMLQTTYTNFNTKHTLVNKNTENQRYVLVCWRIIYLLQILC